MQYPLLYEINTRCWLNELSQTHGRTITLATVPAEFFQHWQQLGFTHIWLMGVWTTGPRSRAQALNDPLAQKEFDACLPGWSEADVAGSPFAVANYHVPKTLGGNAGLKTFRANLRSHGLKLILDFVPNHLGLDHSLVTQCPHLFVPAAETPDLAFLQEAGENPQWLAYGRDPNFPAWIDTAQLDYRCTETRSIAIQLLQAVAALCDGVRCDMAMLLLEEVFAATWKNHPGANADARGEFWAEAIPAVKKQHPDFLFLAEVYWDLEHHLQALGFDYTYDKRVYDHLVARQSAELQGYLSAAAPGFLDAAVHFLENHDEARVASRLSLAEHQAAALLMLSLPGMRLLHDGQLAGARIRTPIALSRRAPETPDPELAALYQRLLETVANTAIGLGHPHINHAQPAWEQNETWRNLILVQWQANRPEFELVVINLAPSRSQCYAHLATGDLAQYDWELQDLLGPENYHRRGIDLQNQGLYLDVLPHAAQIFHFRPAP